MAINYAAYGGINSIAAAIVFAALYVPLAIWYIRTLFLYLRQYVIVLTIFCHIRIASFILRAVLAGSNSAAQNMSVYIAEQVLLSVGYFALLFSAYTLVMDRFDIINQDYFKGGSRQPITLNPIIRLLQHRHLFRLILMAAVVLGIVGISQNSDPQTSSTLRKASVIIFLVLTVLQALHTLMLVKLELADSGIRYPTHSPFGARNGSIILLAISLFLLIREIFITATLGNMGVYQNEHFWYPLVAVPEFIAVALYLVPGLCPETQPVHR